MIDTQENDLRDKIEKAYQVELLINNPILRDTLEALRKNCFDEIRTSKPKDQIDREEIYRELKVIDAFEVELYRHIKEGKKAKSKLDELLSTVKKIF